MGTKTKIEWTEATWNPVRGCSIVSEGCRNCYAMRMAHRSNRPGGAYEGLTRIGPHGPTWTGDVRFVPELLDYPLRLRKPHRIFVNSMSDLFHEKVSFEQISEVFAVMALAPQHTFQLLTKRLERAGEFFQSLSPGNHREVLKLARFVESRYTIPANYEWPLKNVWLGVSVEDQKTADERIPLLLETPAAVRWISAEPLLGPINLDGFLDFEYPHCSGFVNGHVDEGYCTKCGGHITDSIHTNPGSKLDWVVVGGESGPGARPMHPDWVRSLRNQCAAAGVPFFFKQWGAYIPGHLGDCSHPSATGAQGPYKDLDPKQVDVWKCDLCGRLHGWKSGGDCRERFDFHRFGKKAAGNLLDGRQHLEYPA